MSERRVFVVSDLHLGPGRDPRSGALDPLEDFESGPAFVRFLNQIGTAEPVELVIAGDFLEYPQTLPEIGLTSPRDELGTTEAESLLRTRTIMGLEPLRASGHPEVFAALRSFIASGHTVTLIIGNHDIDLLWPSSWRLFFDQLYTPGSNGWLQRRRLNYTVGGNGNGVYIEHGHEYDPANRFGDGMREPFAADPSGTMRLKRCWGTLFVDEVYNQLERERWFIDNVKPITRVVRLGLANDFRFTARALGLIARFLLTSGLPPRSSEPGFGLLGGAQPAEPDANEIVASVADHDLRNYLTMHIAEPEVRRALEQAVADLDQHEWEQIRTGAAPQATLDEQAGSVEAGLLGASLAGDGYRTAAERILSDNPGLRSVIMGHTHGPIDGTTDPLLLSDGRTGFYFNSGTWTRHLREEGQRSYSWAEIGDPTNYTASLTYLALEPDGRGGFDVQFRRWQG